MIDASSFMPKHRAFVRSQLEKRLKIVSQERRQHYRQRLSRDLILDAVSQAG